jgi:Cu+-exporting ATPase
MSVSTQKAQTPGFMPEASVGGYEHHHPELTNLSLRARVAAVVTAAVVLILYATGLFTNVLGLDTALLVAMLAGYPLMRRALQSLHDRRLTYDITLALGAAVAVVAGQFLAAAEVTLIVFIGEGIEHWAIHRVDRAIASLLSVQPVQASVIRDGQAIGVPAADVRLTDRVLVRGGERVPIDGVVLEGEADVDQSLITGEPIAVTKGPGAKVFGGTIVERGAIDVQPEAVGDDTTIAHIARLVADARRRRAPIVRVADRISQLFLPALIGSAAAIYLMTGDVLRSVAMLLVGCSCALVYAAPAAFSASLARLSRDGILVKGGDVLERLATVTTVAFDKTGTLTLGRPTVSKILVADGFEPEDVLRLAAAAESRSEHCLGRAIVEEAQRRQLVIPTVEQFVPSAGLGVAASVEGCRVRVGNRAFMREPDAPAVAGLDELVATAEQPAETHVFVLIDRQPAGLVLMHDAPRPEAGKTIATLAAAGINRVAMLTGDARGTALSVARKIGIHNEQVYSDLLPADKLTRLREMATAGEHVLMVGDGINDAPALATAHAGAAFGRGASDLSAEAAQIVILEPGLDAIPKLITFAQRTIERVRFNILAFAVGVNVVAIFAAAAGYLTPAAAAILHQVVSVTVILSSVSLLFDRGLLTGRGGLDGLSADRLKRWFLESVVEPARQFIARHRRRLAWALSGAAVVAWALSGLTILQPDQTAVVQRFGRLVAMDLPPGLHVRAPWPIETVTRLSTTRIRVVEIGFRTPPNAVRRTVDYEWNTFHGIEGAIQLVPDENLVLTGDENLAELYAVIHYRVARPSQYLFGARDPDVLVRVMAEGALRSVTADYGLDALLTTDRKTLERDWAKALRSRLARTDVGVEVLGIHLNDVHPPVEVVSAFREVASAQEEELMNTLKADAYLMEQVPVARGRAAANLEGAAAYRASRIDHSVGDAARFLAQVAGPDATTALARFRLQLETLEAVLPGKRLVILDDHSGGKRTLMFLQDGTDGLKLDLLKLLSPGSGGEPEEPDIYRRQGSKQ